MTRELTRPADIAAAIPPGTMTFWAVQGLRPGVRVFTRGDAIAVACPALARRDRLVVTGPLTDAVPLVRQALTEAGDTYRPLGDEQFIRDLAAHIPEVEFVGTFDWMETHTPTPAGTSGTGTLVTAGVNGTNGTARAGTTNAAGTNGTVRAGVPAPAGTPNAAGTNGTARADITVGAGTPGASRPETPGTSRPETSAMNAPHTDGTPGEVTWLTPGDDPGITALLADVNPGSYAVPGLPGVRRWAGIRSGGTPVSVAADAWSTPGAGFVAGVATAATHRRQGHAETVCRFLIDALHAQHGYVALMVDTSNHTAAGVYHRLGFTGRTVAAARVTPT